MRGQHDSPLEKSSDVYRIALIGDSFVFGHGVNDAEVVSAVLEDELNKTDHDKRFEVLNFAVSGFGQAEELVMYRNKIRKYQPDEVVLFYYTNDIGNNAVSQLFKIDERGNLVRTGASYLPGVKLREILYSIAPIRWLFEHSQAWNLIRNRLSGIVHNYLLKKQGLKDYKDNTNLETITLTKLLLQQFIEEIKADQANSVVFIIPSKNMQSNFPFTPSERKGSHVC